MNLHCKYIRISVVREFLLLWVLFFLGYIHVHVSLAPCARSRVQCLQIVYVSRCLPYLVNLPYCFPLVHSIQWFGSVQGSSHHGNESWEPIRDVNQVSWHRPFPLQHLAVNKPYSMHASLPQGILPPAKREVVSPCMNLTSIVCKRYSQIVHLKFFLKIFDDAWIKSSWYEK